MHTVKFINAFEVPAGQESRFMRLWEEVNTYMRNKPGYVSHRLHRSLSTEARYRFVNYAEWASVEAFQAAHDDGFRTLVQKAEWKEYTTTPALYEIVHEGGAR